MQGIAILLVGITRLIISIGVLYLIYKLGKFLDVLPGVLAARKEEKSN